MKRHMKELFETKELLMQTKQAILNKVKAIRRDDKPRPSTS